MAEEFFLADAERFFKKTIRCNGMNSVPGNSFQHSLSLISEQFRKGPGAGNGSIDDQVRHDDYSLSRMARTNSLEGDPSSEVPLFPAICSLCWDNAGR